MDSNGTESNSIAPLRNVAAAANGMKRAMNRAHHLPGLVVMHGPSGYGKSSAAAFVAVQHRAYYVEMKASWSGRKLLESICVEAGLRPKARGYEMVEDIAQQLMLSGRPLIIDELDHVIAKGAIELVRDLYESSSAAILLIGEENVPKKLERYERFHGRVLDWVPAQPADINDLRHLQKLYTPELELADDLAGEVLRLARGSVRRICVNLERIREAAAVEDWQTVDRATWGNRPLYSGQSPAARQLA